jgi:hypothetical protein
MSFHDWRCPRTADTAVVWGYPIIWFLLTERAKPAAVGFSTP